MVLSLGAVLIYEAFFTCLDSFNYYSNYLNLAPLMDEKIWQAQDSLTHFDESANIDTGGEFALGNKNFKWDLAYSLIDETKDLYKLYKIDLSVSWQEGRRRARLLRNTYAIYQKE